MELAKAADQVAADTGLQIYFTCPYADIRLIKENTKQLVSSLEENLLSSLDFSSLEDIKKLRTLIGKRFYAVPYTDEEDGEEYYNMVIE